MHHFLKRLTAPSCERALFFLASVGLAVVLVMGRTAYAEPADTTDGGVCGTPAIYEKTVQKGVRFLSTLGQAEDGSYTKESGIGVTALATAALLRNGLEPGDPRVASSLDYLVKSIQPDGGIYTEGSFLRNYETSVAIFALREANRDGRFDETLERAARFLRGIQWGADKGTSQDDLNFGGAGYGKHKRPDLSNTSYLIDALRAAGAGPNDRAIQDAVLFVSRCQNLESANNTTPFAVKNPDGGFYYTCAAGGQSKSGETPTGGLRSYGSMTYAGLKSMIHAGLGPDDPRVKAATEWIQKHYSLESNPGLGAAGLYYYYHTFAKTLSAMGVDRLVDDRGNEHDWRAELIGVLAARQQPGGSWINEKNERWLEGDPNLSTAYALLALSYCRPGEP